MDSVAVEDLELVPDERIVVALESIAASLKELVQLAKDNA